MKFALYLYQALGVILFLRFVIRDTCSLPEALVYVSFMALFAISAFEKEEAKGIPELIEQYDDSQVRADIDDIRTKLSLYLGFNNAKM